ncbi:MULTISPECIES: LysR family transcriptional regulator [unclassified Adlercreutzia]|uniref:LysR family transcriptional regulator n=1 Tax=unclassified Adlercreutzia TaxID=2636013 RepID=UPI0013EB170D|nr:MULTISPECIES: LysR family transcriptional regulator [unclassified Adlercreutzia]
MRIETLHYLEEIARSGSFSQAASKLYISQQGLSKMVDGVEKELGTSLFSRQGRSAELTEDGRLVLDFARSVSSQYADLKETILHRQRSQSGSFDGICITAMPFVCTRTFDIINEDLVEYELGDFTLIEQSFPEIMDHMERGELDFALVNILKEDYESRVKPSGHQFVPLYSTEVTMLASSALLSRVCLPQKTISAKDILRLPLAHYNEPMLNRIANMLAESIGEKSYGPRLHSSNARHIIALVEEGRAVTFGDTFSASVLKQKDGVVSLRIDPTPLFYVGFVLARDREEPSDHDDFIRCFKAVFDMKHKAYLDANPPVID